MVKIGLWRLCLILIVAGAVVAPGLVEASSFGGGGGGGGSATLTGTAESTNPTQCGITTTENDQDNSGSSDYIQSISTTGATNFGAFYSSVTFSLVTDQQGTGGYEYLDGEFDIGCYNTPTSPTALTFSVTGSASNVGWAVTAIESITATGTAPTTTYCTPGTKAPTTQTGACGGAASVEGSCGLSNPTYDLPNDWQSGTTADWYTWDLVSGTHPCGTMSSITPSGGITNTNTYLGIVSFAIGSASGTSTPSSTSWTLTL